MAIYRDSVGNVYDRLPIRKPVKSAKGAKPGPKHGRKTRYTGAKKKHGPETGKNGASSRTRYFGEPKPRAEQLDYRRMKEKVELAA